MSDSGISVHSLWANAFGVDLPDATAGPTGRRELADRLCFGLTCIVAAAACAVLLPGGHPFSFTAPVAAILLALTTRFALRCAWGWIGCQQAAFVLLLFALPLNLVPAAVLACTLVGYPKTGEHWLTELAVAVVNSTYALTPALLLWALAPGPAGWNHWPAYLVTFGGQFVASALIMRARCGIRGKTYYPREELTALSVDAPLTVIGLAAAVEIRLAPGGAIALIVAATALLALADRENGQRLAQTRRALRDPLTELANRVLFSETATACEARCRRKHEDAALLLIDLDDFKLVNDTYGHQAGDEVLLTVADRLRGATRGADVAARLGGDEFAVILAEPMTLDDAHRVAEDLMRSVAQPVNLSNGQTVDPSCSVGVALFGSEISAQDAAAEADRALYEQKRLRQQQNLRKLPLSG